MNKKPTSSKDKNNKKLRKHRALILQGGGALGAYQVGVIRTLYKRLIQEDTENGQNNDEDSRPLFDIVAGTSIGAMNAAVLVGNVIRPRKSKNSISKNKIWEIAIDQLESFWKKGLIADVWPLDDFEFWKPWKYKWYNKIKNIASREAARRYYSTKTFVFGGKKVFSMKEIRPDLRFLDPENKRLVLNDEPLMKKLDEFGNFPIASSFEKGQPRLLVTAVDLAEGVTVTFDSYKKSGGIRKTEYYLDGKYGCKKSNNKYKSKRIVIKYNDGIDLEHVMASGIKVAYFVKETL